MLVATLPLRDLAVDKINSVNSFYNLVTIRFRFLSLDTNAVIFYARL